MPLEIVLEDPTALVERNTCAAGGDGAARGGRGNKDRSGTRSVAAVLKNNLRVEYELQHIPEIKLYKLRDTAPRRSDDVPTPYEVLSSNEHRARIVRENAAKAVAANAPKSSLAASRLDRTGRAPAHKRTLIGADVTKHMLSTESKDTATISSSEEAATSVEVQSKVWRGTAAMTALIEQQNAAARLSSMRRRMNTQQYQQQSEGPRKELIQQSNVIRSTLQVSCGGISRDRHITTAVAATASSSATKTQASGGEAAAKNSAAHRSAPGAAGGAALGGVDLMAQQLRQRTTEEIVNWAMRDTDFYKDNLESTLFQLEAQLKEEALGVEATVDDLMGETSFIDSNITNSKEKGDVGYVGEASSLYAD